MFCTDCIEYIMDPLFKGYIYTSLYQWPTYIINPYFVYNGLESQTCKENYVNNKRLSCNNFIAT